MSDDAEALSDFSGVARLFPLPNVVLFPHVIQPLHIFEPRYRQMTADALDGDGLIAMVLLKPNWEPDYEGRPEVYDVACLGRIVNEERLPDGKFNIHLRGLCRLRLEEEVPTTKPYRSAQGWPVPDPAHADMPDLREHLLNVAKAWLPEQGPITTILAKLFQENVPLGTACDVLGYALPFPVEIKQALLEELDIEQRARRLIHELQTTAPPELLHHPRPCRYPPDFSTN